MIPDVPFVGNSPINVQEEKKIVFVRPLCMIVETKEYVSIPFVLNALTNGPKRKIHVHCVVHNSIV